MECFKTWLSYCSVAALLFMSFIPAYGADNNDELIIVNHFNNPLQFTVGINPTTLPDLPVNFTLTPNSEIKTKVLDQKEAYIRVEDANKNHAFFGVNIEKNRVLVHGYLSSGIAFSSTNIITFCTPEEYKKKHSC